VLFLAQIAEHGKHRSARLSTLGTFERLRDPVTGYPELRALARRIRPT